MNDVAFAIGVTALLAFCVPFLYYTYIGYQWAMENMPEGYDYPYASKLRISLVGALWFGLQKKVIHAIFKPKMRKWCKA